MSPCKTLHGVSAPILISSPPPAAWAPLAGLPLPHSCRSVAGIASGGFSVLSGGASLALKILSVLSEDALFALEGLFILSGCIAPPFHPLSGRS